MCLNRNFRLRAGIVLALNIAFAVSQAGPAKGQAAGGLQKGDDAIGAPAANKENRPDPRLQRGRKLFIKRWKNADVASPTGDGLGPVFNGHSCAECHNQIRPGGAGSIEHNVCTPKIVPNSRSGWPPSIPHSPPISPRCVPTLHSTNLAPIPSTITGGRVSWTSSRGAMQEQQQPIAAQERATVVSRSSNCCRSMAAIARRLTASERLKIKAH